MSIDVLNNMNLKKESYLSVRRKSCIKNAPAPFGAGERGRRGAHSSSFSTATKASWGTATVPRERIFFLPSFCFSSSFFFRVMSPP